MDLQERGQWGEDKEVRERQGGEGGGARVEGEEQKGEGEDGKAERLRLKG